MEPEDLYYLCRHQSDGHGHKPGDIYLLCQDGWHNQRTTKARDIAYKMKKERAISLSKVNQGTWVEKVPSQWALPRHGGYLSAEFSPPELPFDGEVLGHNSSFNAPKTLSSKKDLKEGIDFTEEDLLARRLSNEKKAMAVGNDKDLLLKRLNGAKSIFIGYIKKQFENAKFDFENKKLVGDNGYYLQWKLRKNPNIPTHRRNNDQSSVGFVELLRIDSDGDIHRV